MLCSQVTASSPFRYLLPLHRVLLDRVAPPLSIQIGTDALQRAAWLMSLPAWRGDRRGRRRKRAISMMGFVPGARD